VSAAPVVTVAVKVVLGVRLAAGGKRVATRPVESRETVPATFAPVGSVKVNVEVLIVAGFIALLNVALITAMLGQRRVKPFVGVTETTVGAVRGLPGPPALSGSPHPATRAATRNAEIQILLTFNLRISFSSSPSHKAFHASMNRRRDISTPGSTVCSIWNTTHQHPAYSNA
jgi:hypothetical protein